MPKTVLLAAPLGALLLSGCLARTAVDIVTLPVKVASGAVDAVTTSQSEADEKRGRELRRREEKLGKLRRSYDKANAGCLRGDRDACQRAAEARNEIDELAPAVPYQRR